LILDEKSGHLTAISVRHRDNIAYASEEKHLATCRILNSTGRVSASGLFPITTIFICLLYLSALSI